MMVLPEASAPPAVGVKVNVAATLGLAATRSAAAMANVPIATLLTKAGTAAPALTPSAEVFTVRPVWLLATAGPVVSSPFAKVILEVPTGKSAV